QIEMFGTAPWMAIAVQSKEQLAALDKLLGIGRLSRRLSRGLIEEGQRTGKPRSKDLFEFYSRLELVGITPSGELIVVESRIWVLGGNLASEWMTYICRRSDYKALQADFDAEQARVRKEIKLCAEMGFTVEDLKQYLAG